MNMDYIFLDTSPSHDPVSIAVLMKMHTGVYAGKTLSGDDAAILIKDHDPIVTISAVISNDSVHVYEYFSDGTVNEFDQILNI